MWYRNGWSPGKLRFNTDDFQLQEAIVLVLVVGLAVDYCVHIAEAYCRSPHQLRTGRLHDAIEHMGVSVLSGFILSFGSAAFLLACEIVVMSRFGALICLTQSMSVLYTFSFFCTTLGIIGPQHQQGSLKPHMQRLYDKYLKKHAVRYLPYIKDKKNVVTATDIHELPSPMRAESPPDAAPGFNPSTAGSPTSAEAGSIASPASLRTTMPAAETAFSSELPRRSHSH